MRPIYQPHDARRQTLFREINERVVDLNHAFDGVEDDPGRHLIEVICECGRIDCTTSIELTRREYASVREDPTYFLLAPLDEVTLVERVIAHTPRYVVVQKEGRAAEIARHLHQNGQPTPS